MIDLTKNPKIFYRIAVDGIIDKMHIVKIGNHNQIKAHPANTKPGRSCSWIENDGNVFATEEEAKADIHIQPVKQSVGSLWPEKLD
jgi:hypothetical protein